MFEADLLTVTFPKRIAVVNRGEAAVRLIRAVRELNAQYGCGIKTIALHTDATYRVFMLGFMPGFAYMGIVDAHIAAPRRETPRVRVPRGAVGIAGSQTGVHPVEAPSGWQLIGRTPVRPFDSARAEPFLMKPGDSVRFYPIDRAKFDQMEDAAQAAS